MTEPAPPSPSDDASSVLTQYVPEEPEFNPEPMQAPHGQAPESLLGKRMALARAHFGLNVEALSRLTKLYDEVDGRGISPASLARYESNDSQPGAREIRLLCTSLGIKAQWLIFGDVGTPGESKGEQALLSALKGFVAEQVAAVADSAISGASIFQWSEGQVRARRLRDARKP